ncbi:hypothetical protein Tco_1044608 [Tanacetum coccineum]|uniref:Uncharacterized protein n=1 Tax=Tanacetum coccineum TaxID=301880 RepID=A0ABQ5GQR8_9ASTR
MMTTPTTVMHHIHRSEEHQPMITPFTEINHFYPDIHLSLPRRRVMLLAPGQPIPHGRPYRYHLNGPESRHIIFSFEASSLSFFETLMLDHSSPDLPSTSTRGYLARDAVPHDTSMITNPEIQAEIDECFAYADALRDRGIDAKVVVEAID